MSKFLLFIGSMLLVIPPGYGNSLLPVFTQFNQIYHAELGASKRCDSNTDHRFRVCSNALKNEGNGPYIFHHGQSTDKVVVLFHGLSDSPFFLRSIAQAIYQQGANVVVALLPGHGKLDADHDMQDPTLGKRWSTHVEKIMALAPALGNKVYIGGFSTGGTLATQYVLTHPGKVQALLLYSGALELDSTVETLANIWGIKWLAKTLDGDYPSSGPNPYKYPSVARYSAFQLSDIIFKVRDLLEQQKVDLPIFAAHSQADLTTMYSGIKQLMQANQGDNVLFTIPEDLAVCHADLVLDEGQIVDMHFDRSQVTQVLPCSVPQANPVHQKMLAESLAFLQQH